MKSEIIITLLETPKIGPKIAQFIVDNVKDNTVDVSDLMGIIENLKALNKRVPIVKLEDLKIANDIARQIIYNSQKNNIAILTRYCEGFPEKLRIIPDSPLVIYTKGNNELLSNNKAVAVIGTRLPSQYGEKLGTRITEIFVENNFVIVSGLALGCDSIAHKTCVDKKGKTIAVLPSGLDEIYPKENIALSNSILENGGLLFSEYKIGQKARPNHFIARDRLQSGLSDGVCVIETDIKGGTMHTVGFAEKQGRQLGCLNHPEEYRNFKTVSGNQLLIKEKRAFSLGTKEEIEFFISLIKK